MWNCSSVYWAACCCSVYRNRRFFWFSATSLPSEWRISAEILVGILVIAGASGPFSAKSQRMRLHSGKHSVLTLHYRSNENETMKTITIAALTLAMITAASAQNQTTFRDASGRTTGTVTTDSNGTRTFRDGSGRTTGTATRDSNGTTTFRDASGRTTGTATAPRR